MQNELIYGRNPQEKIVSIEINDDQIEIFIEEDGLIKSLFLPNRFWILSPNYINNKCIRLKGNLYYKYGLQFDTREEFLKARSYLRKKDIFSVYDPKEGAMIKDGLTYYKGLKPTDVSILSFDIESTGLLHNSDSNVLIISNTFRYNNIITRKLFSYDQYKSTGDMLIDWCKWVREINPSIICGHNISSYDLKYLQFVANKEHVDLNLGRDGSAIRFEEFESKFRKDATQFYHYHKPRIYGREVVDTLFLSIRYDISRKYESYGLKQIIKQEGLENTNRVFYDASKIRINYKNPIEFAKIKAYAEFDADDSLALYDLMIAPFFYIAQSVPKSFQSIMESAPGSQINSVLIRSYLQNKHSLPRQDETKQFTGAISLGNPGIYNNCFKIDISSLYPSIILQYEVCDRNKDPDQNFLKMVQIFTSKRLEYKKLAKEDKYYDDLQASYKIFINSSYGFLGSTGLLFNSPQCAEFITKKGREILNQAIKWAEDKKFKIVNADTDSIMFCKKDQSEFSKEEQIILIEEINNTYPEKIKFENDGNFKKVIVVKAKNYILWDGNKIKYKGSAIKAPGKELALREFTNEILDTILNDQTNYTEIYNKYVKEIMNISDIKRWCTRKTITSSVLNPQRTNEQKIFDTISGTDYAEGDRIYTYFKENDTIGLVENFNNDYNKDKILEKLYKTAMIFETILPIDELFLNYKLKRNKTKLEELTK